MSDEGLIGAIEAGGTKFVCALARADGTILARARIDTGTPATTFPPMRDFFAAAAAAHGRIAGFGIATFGPIDIDPTSSRHGVFTTTPKTGWPGASYHEALGEFAAPIALDTDVNGAALGEWLAGAGQGCETLAYTTVGTGIGTGVVHRGEVRGGFSHYEAGHIRPPHDRAADPFPGQCRVHGDCVEGLAAGPAILARWGKDLSQMADRPEAVALIGGYLGHLAATLVLTHMPDRLIFGGGVLKAPGLIEALRTAAMRELGGHVALPAPIERYIVTPGLGDDAGITGAIELARRALLTAAR